MNSKQTQDRLFRRAFKNGFMLDKELLERLPDEHFENVLQFAREKNKRVVCLNDLADIVIQRLEKYYKGCLK